MSINKVILVGRLTQDPEIRSTQQGKEIANISLATSEKWTDSATGEKKEKSEFHRVVVFTAGLVGIIKSYVKKGSKLYIEGKLTTRKWQDKDGQDRYTTEVVLQGFNANLQLLDSNNQSQGNYQKHNKEKQDGYQPQPVDDVDSDCIPF